MTKCIILFVAVLLIGSLLSVSADEPWQECVMEANKIDSCLEYVKIGGKESKPSSDCCAGIKDIVAVNSSCLCVALNRAFVMVPAINKGRIGRIEKTCNVEIQVPDALYCRARGSSPAPAPAPLSPAPSLPMPSLPPAPMFPAPAPVSPLPAPVTPPPAIVSPPAVHNSTTPSSASEELSYKFFAGAVVAGFAMLGI